MSALSQFLRDHFISCPSKKYLHMECPGCGLQRSIVLLIEGEIKASFLMYPALIPLLSVLFYLILHLRFKFANGAIILKYLFILSAILMVGNFLLKIYFAVSVS